MKQREPRLDPELLSLLGSGRVERHAPPDVRARALANARAIVAAGGRRPSATVLQFPVPRVARRRAPIWFPLAAAVSVAVAVAVAASMTLNAQQSDARPVAPQLAALPAAVVREQPLEVPAVDLPTPSARPAATAPGPARPARQVSDAPSPSAELDLFSRAQAAYSRRDFSRALALLAEHARRFPNGHLAEEREALRVRSLARSGHAEASDRAEAAFTQRFPRSALLTHVQSSQTSTAQ